MTNDAEARKVYRAVSPRSLRQLEHAVDMPGADESFWNRPLEPLKPLKHEAHYAAGQRRMQDAERRGIQLERDFLAGSSGRTT